MSVRSVAARARSSAIPPALRARSALQLTQGFFFSALAICLVFVHGHVAETDGISYYGVHPATMPAIFLGFGVGAAGLWWSGDQLAAAGAPPWVMWSMRYVAAGLVVLLATPYNQGTFLNWSHETVGVSMAGAQIVLTLGLLARRRAPGVVSAALVLLFGGVLGAIALPDWHIALLLQGEVLIEVGFAWILLEWTHALEAA